MTPETRAAMSEKDSLREFSVEELTGTKMQTRRWRKSEAEEIGRHNFAGESLNDRHDIVNKNPVVV